MNIPDRALVDSKPARYFALQLGNVDGNEICDMLGPFDTLADCEAGILADANEYLDGCTELQLGQLDDYCMPAVIVQVHRVVQPIPHVSAHVRLKTLKPATTQEDKQ